MKFTSSKILSLVLGLALMGPVAFAQGPAGPGGMHGGFFGEHALDFFSAMLNLTDAQQAQIKQIMTAAKPTAEPLHQQEMQNHKAMMQLIMSSNFDEAKAQSLAQQSASIHEQMEVLHARTFNQAYQVLNAEQKTKLSDFLAKQEQRMEEHRQEHQGPPPPDGQ